jgi:hypothetical protein
MLQGNVLLNSRIQGACVGIRGLKVANSYYEDAITPGRFAEKCEMFHWCSICEACFI